ncbi:HNH endonuclease signature motif containing protein [Gordonia malaquae]|uniref:HNH endonuclease signature motif containing protein n=1 Tax=Gordonia malaquae TaxID=410332 RepID=UPI0030FF1BC1
MARQTGFTKASRELIVARASGMCEVMRQGCQFTGSEIHHRMTRGMGAPRVDGINSPANGLLLCSSCHRWVTENPLVSYRLGWAIRRNGIQAPTTVEVLWRKTSWVLLDDGGRMEIVRPNTSQHVTDVFAS